MIYYGNTDLDKIKVIIFDFDETMYSCSNIKNHYIKFIQKAITDLLSNSSEEALKIMGEYGFTKGGKERVSFGKNCEKFGIPKESWNSYRINNFFQIPSEEAEIVDNSLYRNLANFFQLHIVSTELIDNVLKKGENLRIDFTPFKKISAPTMETISFYSNDKATEYKLIQALEKCKSDEMLVIGDRYSVDIEPLIQMGGSGVLIEKTKDIETFFEKFKGDKQCKISN